MADQPAKNRFKIMIGETPHQCSIELNGEPLNHVRRVSIGVDAAKPAATFLTLEIMGEALFEGEYVDSPIVQIPAREAPLVGGWTSFKDQEPPRDGTTVLLWSPMWEMSWGVVIGHFEDDGSDGGRWVTSEGECSDNDPDFDPDAEVEIGSEALDVDDDGEGNLGPTHWQLLPLTPMEG